MAGDGGVVVVVAVEGAGVLLLLLLVKDAIPGITRSMYCLYTSSFTEKDSPSSPPSPFPAPPAPPPKSLPVTGYANVNGTSPVPASYFPKAAKSRSNGCRYRMKSPLPPYQFSNTAAEEEGNLAREMRAAMMESSRLARVDRTVERLGTDEGAAAAAAALVLGAAAAAYKGRERRRAGDGCIFGEGWGLDRSLFQGERKLGANRRGICAR